MNRKNLIGVLYLIVFTSLCLSSCTSMRRYLSLARPNQRGTIDLIANPTAEAGLPVKMYFSDAKIEKPATPESFKSLWELQRHGQQELINTLNSRYAGAANNDNFIKQLSNKYLTDDDKPTIINLVKSNIRLTFTITRRHAFDEIQGLSGIFSPADRIEYIDYSLTLDPIAGVNSPLRFTGWNKYNTDYGSIDIGDISFDRSISATAGIGGTGSSSNNDSASPTNSITKAGSISPTVSATGSWDRKESQHIKYQYVKLTGRIDQPYRLYLASEGTREVDLAGNVSVDVNTEFQPFPEKIFTFKKLKTDAGAYNAPAAVSISEAFTLRPYILPATPITATLTYNYTYRHVITGRKTFYEWDDRVQYCTGHITKRVVLFHGYDFLPENYLITNTASTQNLQIRIGAGASIVLAFSNYLAARDFLNWLLRYADATPTSPIIIDGYTLMYAGTPLTKNVVLGMATDLIPTPEFPKP